MTFICRSLHLQIIIDISFIEFLRSIRGTNSSAELIYCDTFYNSIEKFHLFPSSNCVAML